MTSIIRTTLVFTMIFITGCSAIHRAAMKGNVNSIEKALSSGANINERYTGDCYMTNMTPLMVAAFTGNTNAVKCLIDKGADTHATFSNRCNIRFYNKQTALVPAAACIKNEGCGEIVDILLKEEATIDPAKNKNVFAALHWASADKKPSSLKALFDNGVDINFAFKNGDTPLLVFMHHVGQTWGEPEFIEFLIANGADVNHKNNDGQTALSMILKKNLDAQIKWGEKVDRYVKIEKILRDAGAK